MRHWTRSTRAADDSAANYAYYTGANSDNLEAIRAIDPLAIKTAADREGIIKGLADGRIS